MLGNLRTALEINPKAQKNPPVKAATPLNYLAVLNRVLNPARSLAEQV